MTGYGRMICRHDAAVGSSRFPSGPSFERLEVNPSLGSAALAVLIEERFGFEVPVVVRSGKQLAAIVAPDPFQGVADNPKRYQVSFLSEKLSAETVTRLHELAHESERVAVHGREVYAWHPDGVARSKLWNALAGTGLGVTATARNWTTVNRLLEMAAA